MRKIILVNDSRFESMIMRDALFAMGYEVKIADEYSAMKQMESFKPDIAIVNLIMRETRGDQFITIIKLQYPQVYCLLSSTNQISLSDFRFKKIDDVFSTPIDRAGFEKVFSRMREKVGSDAQEEAVPVKEGVKFCPHCGNNLGEKTDKKYAFCPFCGGKL